MDSNGSNQTPGEIGEHLRDICSSHPSSRNNNADEPVIPGHALVDVFRSLSERNDGTEFISPAELEEIRKFIDANTGIEVTPSVLLAFIQQRATVSPQESPNTSMHESLEDETERGRLATEDTNHHSGSSRSSSRSSNGTHHIGSLPPKTPHTTRSSNQDSPFDSGRRQRTAPLQHAAPSSWNAKKPLPHSRRRSDAGLTGRALSDSETSSDFPRQRSRSRVRSRAPSNPTSPHSAQSETWDPVSPSYVSSPPMRPHSRAQSHDQFTMMGHPYGSRDRMFSPPLGDRANSSFDYDDHSFEGSVSMNLRMPRPMRSSHSSHSHHPSAHSDSEEDSDEDEDDPTLGLVIDHERSAASSMASLAPQDQLEALQRTNAELGRKLVEAERTLQNRLLEHEGELEAMENRLEEAKSELSAAKREEKELRAKERSNSSQIAALEAEIATVTRDLENAKASYSSLQKQYQEQCAESESLRNSLRQKDQELRDAREKIMLHGVEVEKWNQQREQLENFMSNLEAQLSIARGAQSQLEEQKQENLLLKETIDRMRFDMDELRSKADGSHVTSGSLGLASNQNTISKSLGEEILRMNKRRWIDEDEDHRASSSAAEDDRTVVDDEEKDTDDEDVIQTIITKRKRKVASRANRKLETIQFEDVKEYADAYTQHELSEFTASHMAQTDPEPKRLLINAAPRTSCGVQAHPLPVLTPIAKFDTEVQTDTPERSRSSSPVNEELASSSSTVLPPTPKPPKSDLPPSYAQVADANAQETQQDHAVAEMLHKWHHGLPVPLAPIPGGVSEDALEEWAALKEEMGIECLAIDKVLEMSLKTGRPRSPIVPGDAAESSAAGARRFARKNRFYNIYNTFVYGNPERPRRERDDEHDRERAAGAAFPANMTQAAVVLGMFALAASVLSAPYSQPAYHVPGGPTYYDRAAWSEFNRMYPAGEGFGADGAVAAGLWEFLGRVGGGAARIARGWPT